MKEHLEDFVRGHSQDFDILEPDDRLWEGIDKKLNKANRRPVLYYIYRATAVAALLAVLFSVQQFFSGRQNAGEIPELQEADLYYTTLINQKMEQVKPFLSEYPGLEDELNNDLSELDSIYKDLKEDLKDNIANQEVLEAMIENYRLRIDILEEMVHFLDDTGDEINNNNSEYDL